MIRLSSHSITAATSPRSALVFDQRSELRGHRCDRRLNRRSADRGAEGRQTAVFDSFTSQTQGRGARNRGVKSPGASGSLSSMAMTSGLRFLAAWRNCAENSPRPAFARPLRRSESIVRERRAILRTSNQAFGSPAGLLPRRFYFRAPIGHRLFESTNGALEIGGFPVGVTSGGLVDVGAHCGGASHRVRRRPSCAFMRRLVLKNDRPSAFGNRRRLAWA